MPFPPPSPVLQPLFLAVSQVLLASQDAFFPSFPCLAAPLSCSQSCSVGITRCLFPHLPLSCSPSFLQSVMFCWHHKMPFPPPSPVMQPLYLAVSHVLLASQDAFSPTFPCHATPLSCSQSCFVGITRCLSPHLPLSCSPSFLQSVMFCWHHKMPFPPPSPVIQPLFLAVSHVLLASQDAFSPSFPCLAAPLSCSQSCSVGITRCLFPHLPLSCSPSFLQSVMFCWHHKMPFPPPSPVMQPLFLAVSHVLLASQDAFSPTFPCHATPLSCSQSCFVGITGCLFPHLPLSCSPSFLQSVMFCWHHKMPFPPPSFVIQPLFLAVSHVLLASQDAFSPTFPCLAAPLSCSQSSSVGITRCLFPHPPLSCSPSFLQSVKFCWHCRGIALQMTCCLLVHCLNTKTKSDKLQFILWNRRQGFDDTAADVFVIV